MDIDAFMESFREDLISIFGDNLVFLGIQGSYGRGEATDESDIDPVIILRKCGKEELLEYRDYIDTLPERRILCGFISSADELTAWDSSDRAQLILDTKPIYGKLAPLCPPISRDDVQRAVRQGACSVYHASSHNALHARNWSMLPDLYKSARFTIRMKHYLCTGNYIPAFRDLAAVASEEERIIIKRKNPDSEDDAFLLLRWASGTLLEINQNFMKT